MADETLQEELGKAIRTRRAALGLSQEVFADTIGMHRAYYGGIERGEKNVTVATLQRVAEGLSMKLSLLLKEAGY